MKKKIEIPVYVIVIIVCIVLFIFLVGFIQEKIDDKKYYDDIDLEYEEIDYIVPDEFESHDYSSNYYSYHDDNVSCSFSVSASKIYEEDFKKWFKGTIYGDLNDEVGELEEISINNQQVYHIEVKEEYRNKSHYGFKSSNYYYHVEYFISDYLRGDRDDIDTNICYVSKDKIISSIKVK